MKRNKYGINLDEGIALSSEEEFEILFIESDCDCETRLVDWIQMGEQPLLFGGQIGCGKTTSIFVTAGITAPLSNNLKFKWSVSAVQLILK